MNRSFSPQNNFSSSPRGFQNHYRMQHNQSYQQRMQFRSPNSSPRFPHNNNSSSPSENVRHKNDYVSLGNEFSSPRFHSSPMNYSPRSMAPYKSNNNSFNTSWNNQSNRSSGKSRNSSSYFADVSGSPYSMKNKYHKFPSKQNQDSQNDSNPGHSSNIEDYIHPSMLEDPWKDDMIRYEKIQSLKKKDNSDKTS